MSLACCLDFSSMIRSSSSSTF